MSTKKILSIFVAIGLFGCSVAPPVRNQEAMQAQDVTFVLPAKSATGIALVPTEAARSLRLNNYTKRIPPNPKDSSPKSMNEVVQWSVAGNAFSVKNSRAGIVSDTGEEGFKTTVTYDGTITSVTSGNAVKITFSIQNRVYEAITASYAREVLSPQDIVSNLTRASFPWSIEVDSKFNTESTYANFARLAKKEAFARDGERDPVTGKIFKERFWLKIDGTSSIPVVVETYPYRNGSKAVVHAMLQGDVSGNTVDFVKLVQALTKEVERIVNS